MNDFNDRVQESRWRFQNEVVSYLNELSSTAEDAASIEAEVGRLEQILKDLRWLGGSETR